MGFVYGLSLLGVVDLFFFQFGSITTSTNTINVNNQVGFVIELLPFFLFCIYVFG